MSIAVLNRKPTPLSNSSYLIRLKRSHSILIQLKDKLTSYWLEPTTFKMYETKESLLLKTDILIKVHLELIRNFGNRKSIVEAEINEVDLQLTNVISLEEAIKEYIMTLSH